MIERFESPLKKYQVAICCQEACEHTSLMRELPKEKYAHAYVALRI